MRECRCLEYTDLKTNRGSLPGATNTRIEQELDVQNLLHGAVGGAEKDDNI